MTIRRMLSTIVATIGAAAIVSLTPSVAAAAPAKDPNFNCTGSITSPSGSFGDVRSTGAIGCGGPGATTVDLRATVKVFGIKFGQIYELVSRV